MLEDALSRALHHPKLTGPERTAMELVLVSLRRSVALLQVIQTELDER